MAASHERRKLSTPRLNRRGKQMAVVVPHKFQPRAYQLNIWQAMDSGYRKAIGLWHRRAGKDKTTFNYVIKSTQVRPGVYYYIFPTYAQGKKVIWQGKDKSGMSVLDHIPKELLLKKNEQEMWVEIDCPNFPGKTSLVQIVGSDRMDSLVGTNPVGAVYSEYAIQNPLARELLAPIFDENKGWEIYIYTPRGHNHGYDLYQAAGEQPDVWFRERLTIDDTYEVVDGKRIPIITEDYVHQRLKEGMDENLAQQEYWCSFDGAMQGSFYAEAFKKLDAESRVRNIAWEPSLPVHTAWDLGVGDATGIWFLQIAGNEIRWIDYYEAQGEGLTHYIKKLHEKPYTYGMHFAPHDIKVREFTSGKSRLEIARNMGIRFRVVTKLAVEEGIDAMRRILPRSYFDERKCRKGIQALREYRKEYDEKRREFKKAPLHDWCSHAADASRSFAVGWDDYMETGGVRPQKVSMDSYDPFSSQGANRPSRNRGYEVFA